MQTSACFLFFVAYVLFSICPLLVPVSCGPWPVACLLSVACFFLWTVSCCRFPVACFLFPVACCLLPVISPSTRYYNCLAVLLCAWYLTADSTATGITIYTYLYIHTDNDTYYTDRDTYTDSDTHYTDGDTCIPITIRIYRWRYIVTIITRCVRYVCMQPEDESEGAQLYASALTTLNRAWDLYYVVFRKINKHLPKVTGERAICQGRSMHLETMIDEANTGKGRRGAKL